MNARKNRRGGLRDDAGRRGFSLIELLVAAALAACVTVTAVMIYQNFASAGGSRSAYGTVTVGAPLANFYGGNATAIDAYFAPNYGRVAKAGELREQFLADTRKASAVFCLGRNGLNTIRPTTIPVAAGFRGADMALPDDFRALIDPGAATFVPYRGASTAANASIFILKPSQDADTLAVLAVYDIDLTPTTSPAGTYVSVKRYNSGELTDYYDVFYPDDPKLPATIPFNPLVVCFERGARSAIVDGNAVDRIKKAAQRPFYFVWWPDPSARSLKAIDDGSPAPDDTSPLASYPHMGGRTAFFMVVPMFPAL